LDWVLAMAPKAVDKSPAEPSWVAELDRRQAEIVADLAGKQIAVLTAEKSELVLQAGQFAERAQERLSERNAAFEQLERERNMTGKLLTRALSSEEAALKHHQAKELAELHAAQEQRRLEEAAELNRRLAHEKAASAAAAEAALALAGRPQRASRNERKRVQRLLNEQYEYNPSSPSHVGPVAAGSAPVGQMSAPVGQMSAPVGQMSASSSQQMSFPSQQMENKGKGKWKAQQMENKGKWTGQQMENKGKGRPGPYDGAPSR
jgi:hypothetical protein